MSNVEREAFLEWWESRHYDDEDKEVKKASWCAWQSARQAPASGEVEPVGEIEHDYNLLKVRWYSHPKYGQFKTGDKVYVAHPPAKVPEGWKLVPIESTSDMDIAGMDSLHSSYE